MEGGGRDRLTLLHAVSGYPIANEDANLRCMQSLRDMFPGVPVGYSGHEIGVQVSVAAVALGACMVERHVTLDHDLPGSDHRAALEPKGLALLVRDIRAVEAAMGDGGKRCARRNSTLGTSHADANQEIPSVRQSASTSRKSSADSSMRRR